jgi:hypothetical protein
MGGIVRATVVAGLTLVLCGSAGGACAQTAPASPLAAPAVGRYTLDVEALVWWFKDSPVPAPLITDGFVGAPTTRTYLGGEDLGTGANPGFRLTGSYALGDGSGIEANVFYIPSRSTSASVASTGLLGSTDLVVSYIDAATQRESGTEISFAPIYSGSAREELSNSLLGAELDGTWSLAPAGGWHMDVVGGLRYLRLRETYTLTTSSPYLSPPFPQDIWNTTDRFETTNNFYGAQAGLRARYDQGPVFAAGAVKVALGAMAQKVDVSGSLVTNDYTDFGPTQTYPGGYFALPTNSGSHSRSQFAVVPEVALSLGYRFTPAVAMVASYSFIYASNVVRPGNQIDRTVNPTLSTSYT